MNKKYCVLILILIVAALVIYGCGGSGDGSSSKGSVETINGIVVPPAPDAEEDAASVGGVDSNGNIARDKVERMIATEFGDDPVLYKQAMDYAITQQVAILNPTPENVAAHLYLLNCAEGDQINNLKKVTSATIDTVKRENAYGKAFAGVTLTDEEC